MFGFVRASTLKKVEQENVRLRMRINELEHVLLLLRAKVDRDRHSYPPRGGGKDYRGPIRVKPAPSPAPSGETSHQDSRPSSSD